MIRPFGEAAFLVEVPDAARAQAVARRLRERPPRGVADAVPGRRSVLVEVDPLSPHIANIPEALERLAATASDELPEGRLHEIPVRYGGAGGPDLGDVARLASISTEEVIRRHAAAEMRVLFLGFAPGFAYLGGLDADLSVVPRLASPRTRVPAGSVAIADGMSGIYPADLPGGWRIIGRTSVALFDPSQDPPSVLLPGDRVRFTAITEPP